jgi:signal transduction histidine kinase
MAAATGSGAGTTLPRPPLLQRITSREWTAIDWAFAGLLLAAASLHLLAIDRSGKHPVHHGDPLILFLLLVAAALPTAARRQYPWTALVSATAAVVTLTVIGESFTPEPFLAAPLYMVAVRFARRESLPALAAVEVGLAVSLLAAVALRPTGGDVTFNILLSAAVWFAGDSVRARRAYLAALAEQAAQRQREVEDRARRSQAEERLQIARDLHDVVAHSLSVIAVQSAVGHHVLSSQPQEAANALAAIESTSRGALDELRRMLRVLRRDMHGRPVRQPAPAIADLDRLVQQVRDLGVPVELSVHGRIVALPQSLELSVYRIVQEALTNVVKHADAAATVVDVSFEEDSVIVEVADEGDSVKDRSVQARASAANGAHVDEGEHHGIVGMRERVSLFGGTLAAAHRPGGGFRVRADLPLSGSIR